ncbi:hypothetical protein BME96_08935 [Virgibacillus halodenitrificans]|uniref:Uncharacterized protein n=1 Tax=Virgibacillus halodenitrificans TaxID=1482 RepID=A0AAC9IZZ2_VIRHA|nr:hypothetical protein [Virgibacillus halodenitrificans]APC48285.1 hypothetical protein BME96_08935 [Virgibacillus halodenitrificans]
MTHQYDVHYGLRLGCIILIWFSFGGTIINSADQLSFFSAIILFLIPLAFDYYSHQPIETKNIRRKNIGIWSAVILSSICLGITFTGFNVEFLVLAIWFKSLVWILAAFYIVMAVSDWASYSSVEEVAHRDRIKKVLRDKKSNESFEERVEYYREEKVNT